MVEAKKGVHKAQTGADPIVSRLLKEDKVSWIKKPNLRFLYFMLFPTCMGIELTSGFDSQLINALQIVPSWIDCTLPSPARPVFCVQARLLTCALARQSSGIRKVVSRESSRQHTRSAPSSRCRS